MFKHGRLAKTHLSIVTALANGIYQDGGNNYSTSKNRKAIRYIVDSLKSNLKQLKKKKIAITPKKFNIILVVPSAILCKIISLLYNSIFAETLIYEHAHKAQHEMSLLNSDFEKMLYNL